MAEETLPAAMIWTRLIQIVIYKLSLPKGRLEQRSLFIYENASMALFGYERQTEDGLEGRWVVCFVK